MIYEYKAKVEKIVDGDTVDVIVDLGFEIYTTQRLRLARVDTPEIRGEERPEGLKSKAYVEERIPVGSEVIIKTDKEKGKYGRYIAEIWVDKECLNDELIEKGLGEEYI